MALQSRPPAPRRFIFSSYNHSVASIRPLGGWAHSRLQPHLRENLGISSGQGRPVLPSPRPSRSPLTLSPGPIPSHATFVGCPPLPSSGGHKSSLADSKDPLWLPLSSPLGSSFWKSLPGGGRRALTCEGEGLGRSLAHTVHLLPPGAAAPSVSGRRTWRERIMSPSIPQPRCYCDPI